MLGSPDIAWGLSNLVTRMMRMNNFGALRVFFFQVSNKFLTLFSNFVLIRNISHKISRKIYGQMLLHGTEATQNRDFLHSRATVWQYLSRKQPHSKAFFHGSY